MSTHQSHAGLLALIRQGYSVPTLGLALGTKSTHTVRMYVCAVLPQYVHLDVTPPHLLLW